MPPKLAVQGYWPVTCGEYCGKLDMAISKVSRIAPGGTAGLASGSTGHRFLKSSISHVPQVAAHL